MPLFKLLVFPATPPPEELVANKGPIAIRCLFFDGTLNNRDNIDERGESGVRPKVESGIREAIEKFVNGPEDKARDNTKVHIKKITLDIFGFSRGTASARYGVHRALKAMDTPGLQLIRPD